MYIKGSELLKSINLRHNMMFIIIIIIIIIIMQIFIQDNLSVLKRTSCYQQGPVIISEIAKK